ncbi:hypothetical protein CDLVIII_5083 [Clostridium sp. DL-VIII]|uniref:hypothetical protein n=1 Tax=Clostridium sp. DL-VIII TaxID=641107 RepID=UPI00023B0704|nr:hypothetical protein [Clostridium sp. DL-VIII]EHJ01574.1 hypothetical protein CDLVIII_5083 [Clostridium sp. DL-VIII]
MLGKLMKYEIKATGRTLVPLYVVLLAFAIINKIFLETGLSAKLENLGLGGFSSIPFILSAFAYGCTMAAVFIVTFFVIVQRFYRNLLGDQGYLMNTLPVSTTANIASKLSIATFWNIISGIIAILSIIIMTFDPGTFGRIFSDFFRVLSEAYGEFGIQTYIIILEIIIATLMQLAKFVCMIYASISIGHLFSKHKILYSFGAFVVLNLIAAAISSTIGIAFSLSNLRNLNIEFIWHIHLIIILVIIFNLIFFLVYFIITNYILKNKLNLE